MEQEFELIAGCEGVRNEIREADRLTQSGAYDGAEDALKRAEELKRELHALQTSLIGEWEGSMTPLVAHAMDHVFSFDLEIGAARRFNELARRIDRLERNG